MNIIIEQYREFKSTTKKMFEGDDDLKKLHARRDFFLSREVHNTYFCLWTAARIMLEKLNKDINEKKAKGS